MARDNGHVGPGPDDSEGVSMSKARCVDLEALQRQLVRIRRRSARASRIHTYTPELVELLYPAGEYPDLTAAQRATATENLIRRAVDVIGGDDGQALAIVLGLPAGLMGRSLEDRRARAARHLGIQPATWRHYWNEPRLFYDLAVEIHRLHTVDPTPHVTAVHL